MATLIINEIELTTNDYNVYNSDRLALGNVPINDSSIDLILLHKQIEFKIEYDDKIYNKLNRYLQKQIDKDTVYVKDIILKTNNHIVKFNNAYVSKLGTQDLTGSDLFTTLTIVIHGESELLNKKLIDNLNSLNI
jgi:hypothetical protein